MMRLLVSVYYQYDDNTDFSPSGEANSSSNAATDANTSTHHPPRMGR